jgi:cephalosporin hydroxylase
MGGSAVLMCLAKRLLGGTGKITSVDIDFSSFQRAFNRNVYRIGKFQDIHTKMEMSSFDLPTRFNQLEGIGCPPEFSLAFIDGWHSFKGVLTDFNAVDTYMKPGAIVLFHDTYPQPYPEGKILEFTRDMFKHYDEWMGEELPGDEKFSSQQEYYQAEKKQNFRIDEAVAFILEERPYELINLPTIHGQTHFDRVKEYTHGTTSPYPGIVAIRKKENYA